MTVKRRKEKREKGKDRANLNFTFLVSLLILYGPLFSSSASLKKECSDSWAHRTHFQSLLARMESRERSLTPSDTLLYADRDFVVMPALGSITPLYVLFVPKKLFFNFAQVSMHYKHQPIPLIADILSKEFNYQKGFIWFEHGGTSSGSVFGSNVDHGHIHIILAPKFTFESFREKVQAMDKRTWKSAPARLVYDNHDYGQDYLAFGDENTAFWTNLETPKIPQFFRRVVAELVGRSSEWNYREFPHHAQAKETVHFIRARSSTNKVFP